HVQRTIADVEFRGRRVRQHGGAAAMRAPRRHIHRLFKVSIKSMTFLRIVFCSIARNPRTRVAPSRVARNERIALSDNSPSFCAGIFLPTVGAPSKK